LNSSLWLRRRRRPVPITCPVVCTCTPVVLSNRASWHHYPRANRCLARTLTRKSLASTRQRHHQIHPTVTRTFTGSVGTSPVLGGDHKNRCTRGANPITQFNERGRPLPDRAMSRFPYIFHCDNHVWPYYIAIRATGCGAGAARHVTREPLNNATRDAIRGPHRSTVAPYAKFGDCPANRP
jgi:hypothetical protein